MSFTDVVSAAGLAMFAKVGLALFAGAFAALMIRTWFVYRPARAAEVASLPLADDAVIPHAAQQQRGEAR